MGDYSWQLLSQDVSLVLQVRPSLYEGLACETNVSYVLNATACIQSFIFNYVHVYTYVLVSV